MISEMKSMVKISVLEQMDEVLLSIGVLCRTGTFPGVEGVIMHFNKPAVRVGFLSPPLSCEDIAVTGIDPYEDTPYSFVKVCLLIQNLMIHPLLPLPSACSSPSRRCHV